MKLLSHLLLLLLIPIHLWAQPTIESVTPFSDNTDLSTYTTGAITVPSSANLGIAICITSGENSSSTNPTVTSVSYSLGGGEAFTEIVSTGNEGQPTESHYATLWYRVNPTVGTTGTISWTHTNTVASGTATIFVLSGAGQSNPTVSGDDPTGSSSPHAGPWSVGLTTTVDNSLLLTCVEHSNSTIEFTHGTGQTEQSDFSANELRHGTSTEVKVTAGLETLTVDSVSGSPTGRFAAMAVEPVTAPAPSTRRRAVPVRFR